MDLNPIHHLSPGKKIKCSYFDYVQLLVLARLVNGLEPIHQCSPAKKNEMLIFGLCSLLKICLADLWTWTPSATPLQPIKWNAHFWITFNFWCSAGLVNGLEPHPSPVSRQKKEILIFWLCSTSDDLPGWLMNLNPIYHPSPTKKMKCSIFDYIQLLMISQAGRWTQSPSAIPLQPKKWNAHFCITFNFWCWPDWSMDSNPIHHSSPANKMKCLFLYYVELLMISRAGWWTQTPSANPLQPIKWIAHFWITFNFLWLAGLVNGLKLPLPPLCSQKSEMLIFVLHSTSDVGQIGQWTWTSSTTPLQPKIWNAHFRVTFNFWWLVGLFDELKPHLPPLCSQ